MKKLVLSLVVGGVLGGYAATVAAEEAIPSVKVNGVKNPELRSYRTLVAGMDAFDKYHDLAPAAPELRYRVIPKSRRAKAQMDSLSIKIEAKDFTLPVALAADGTFVLPRDQSAFDADAALVLNRTNGQFEGLPRVRTPGLADNVMRLGDLRLECKVLVAAIKNELGFVARATVTTLMGGSEWCDAKSGDFWHDAPGLLDGATITSGNRSAALPMKEESFLPPLADKSWPDDALIVLELDTSTH